MQMNINAGPAFRKLSKLAWELENRLGEQQPKQNEDDQPLRVSLQKCLRCCTELNDSELELTECERAVERTEGSVWSVKTRRIAVPFPRLWTPSVDPPSGKSNPDP